MISVADLELWLTDRTTPKLLEYHQGYLACDRRRYETHEGRLIEVTHEPLCTIAERLYDLYERNKVILFQARIAPYKWSYFALRRGR